MTNWYQSSQSLTCDSSFHPSIPHIYLSQPQSQAPTPLSMADPNHHQPPGPIWFSDQFQYHGHSLLPPLNHDQQQMFLGNFRPWEREYDPSPVIPIHHSTQITLLSQKVPVITSNSISVPTNLDLSQPPPLSPPQLQFGTTTSFVTTNSVSASAPNSNHSSHNTYPTSYNQPSSMVALPEQLSRPTIVPIPEIPTDFCPNTQNLSNNNQPYSHSTQSAPIHTTSYGQPNFSAQYSSTVPAFQDYSVPFSGNDPYGFIQGYEEFFKVNPMNEVDMIQYVMQDFEGEALEWYYQYVEGKFLETWTPDCWEDFVTELYGRFAGEHQVFVGKPETKNTTTQKEKDQNIAESRQSQSQNPSSALIESENQYQESEPNFSSGMPMASPDNVISQATMDGTVNKLRLAIKNPCMSEILKESEMAVLRIEWFCWKTDIEIALFRKGLLETVVLIYLLRLAVKSLIDMDMVNSLLTVLRKKEDDFLNMCMKPQSASMFLLGQIVGSDEESTKSGVMSKLISKKVIANIVSSLEAEWQDERIVAVGILLRCMQEYGNCRNIIVDKAELASVLESFLGANDALQDQGPVVAGLLLVGPRKTCLYREEAIDTLISCLRNSDFPAAQIVTAETILALQGRFSYSGKPLARAFLLKSAGLDKSYKSLIRKKQLTRTSEESEETMGEEKAAEGWERKMAFVLVSHEFGLIFETLTEGLKSKHAELCSACFVSTTWLVQMLTIFPDTGIQGEARVCLLKLFVSIFKLAKGTEDRALSMIALSSFIRDLEELRDLTSYMKDLLKGMGELKKPYLVALERLKVFSNGNDSCNDMWNHTELVQEDCSVNGEVLSVVCFKDKILSGHSDGTIKVWTGKGNILHFIQETREHTKEVTSLVVSQSGDKLYSSSLDKTMRVWAVSNEGMQCEQVYDMNDHVNSLAVANRISCFIPQGAGIKDNSTQKIDLATGTISTIQGVSRHFMAKTNPIYALQVYGGLLYSASYPLDAVLLGDRGFGVAMKALSGPLFSVIVCVEYGLMVYHEIPETNENSWKFGLKKNSLYWGERGKMESIAGCLSYFLKTYVLNYVGFTVFVSYNFLHLNDLIEFGHQDTRHSEIKMIGDCWTESEAESFCYVQLEVYDFWEFISDLGEMILPVIVGEFLKFHFEGMDVEFAEMTMYIAGVREKDNLFSALVTYCGNVHSSSRKVVAAYAQELGIEKSLTAHQLVTVAMNRAIVGDGFSRNPTIVVLCIIKNPSNFSSSEEKLIQVISRNYPRKTEIFASIIKGKVKFDPHLMIIEFWVALRHTVVLVEGQTSYATLKEWSKLSGAFPNFYPWGQGDLQGKGNCQEERPGD